VSKENVEIVRRSFEAFARGDLDAAFADLHPDIEWCTAHDEPDQQTYRGIDGMRRFAATIEEPWEDRFAEKVTADAFIDRGDLVVVPWHGLLHGRGSGIEIEISETYVARLRDGKIVRVDEFRTREEALEAVDREAGSSSR
jgi:ketosteroid isomerase-like protein